MFDDCAITIFCIVWCTLGVLTSRSVLLCVFHKSGREVYCVVTDKYGNKAQTEPVTLTMNVPEGYTGPQIVTQPESVTAARGEVASTTVVAEGEGLSYQWYGREANGREFKSGLKGDTYFVAMVPSKSGREVWCVITDQYGNSVTSETATLTMEP